MNAFQKAPVKTVSKGAWGLGTHHLEVLIDSARRRKGGEDDSLPAQAPGALLAPDSLTSISPESRWSREAGSEFRCITGHREAEGVREASTGRGDQCCEQVDGGQRCYAGRLAQSVNQTLLPLPAASLLPGNLILPPAWHRHKLRNVHIPPLRRASHSGVAPAHGDSHWPVSSLSGEFLIEGVLPG